MSAAVTMTNIDSIDRPERLIKLFKRMGYEVRRTGKTHYMVYGPKGATLTVPQTWGDPRARANTLADARRAGLLPTKGEELIPLGVFTINEWSIHNHDIPKTILRGKRPELNYVKEQEDDMAFGNPDTYALKSELAQLVDIVAGMDARLKALDNSVEKGFGVVKDRFLAIDEKLAGVKVKTVKPHAPTVYDRTRETRELLMETFRKLPAGVPLNPKGITIVMGRDPENFKEVDHIRRQLNSLSESGQLVRRGSEGTGSAPLYFLPVPAEEEEA